MSHVLPPGSILHVRYEQLVENQEHEIRRLLDDIGVDWDEMCLKFHENRRQVQTASFIQVRQKLYSNSTNR